MKSLFLSCVLSLSLLAGCPTTYYVPQNPGAEEFMDARATLQLGNSTVTLLDGNEISLDSTSLHPTFVAGVKEETGERVELPLSSVKEISRTDIGRGAWRGAQRGFIVGGCLGLIGGGLRR